MQITYRLATFLAAVDGQPIALVITPSLLAIWLDRSAMWLIRSALGIRLYLSESQVLPGQDQ